MKNFSNDRKKMDSYIAVFIMILMVLQPLLDVLSYWLIKVDNTSITTLLRILMLGVIVIYSFIITDNKKFYLMFYGIIGLYWLGHMINCFRIGYINPVSDMSLFIRVAQMPALTLSFITFFKRNKGAKESMYKGLSIGFMIVIAVIILAQITGTMEYMYYPNIGIKGWFYTGNAQSIIVTVLSTFIIYRAYNYKNRTVFIITCFLAFGLLFISGTRVTYFSIFIIALGLFIILLFNRKNNWVYYTGLILSVICCGSFFFASPMLQEKGKMSEGFQESQKSIDSYQSEEATKNELFEKYGEDKVLEGKPYTLNEYKLIYESNMWLFQDAVDRYGFESFLEKYEYTTDASKLGDNRLLKRTIAELEWEKQDFITKLFGYENDTLILNGNVYIPENDFSNLIYFNGYIGTGLYILFVLYFVILIILSLIKNLKKAFTVEAGMVGIAFLLMLGAAQLSGQIVQRPNVSIYLSAILALIYHLTVIENDVNPYLGLKKLNRENSVK